MFISYTSTMSYQRETNPHFLPQHSDPTIELPLQTPSPRRSRPPPLRYQQHTSAELPQAHKPQLHFPPHQGGTPSQSHQEPPLPRSHQEPFLLYEPYPKRIGERNEVQQHGPMVTRTHPSSLQGPKTHQTRLIGWLLTAFCVLFWIIVIVGGLIILIVYLVFRPQNPRFDISDATFNAAYLDSGNLLNADIILLANFTNPNTKVVVDFTYIMLDLYYEDNFVAAYDVEPFSVIRGQSRFESVHLMISQAKLSLRHSMDLQRQMESGRVDFEIRGVFRTKSRFGCFLKYSYWLYSHCQIAITGPPQGVLIGKKCVTKR